MTIPDANYCTVNRTLQKCIGGSADRERKDRQRGKEKEGGGEKSEIPVGRGDATGKKWLS